MGFISRPFVALKTNPGLLVGWLIFLILLGVYAYFPPRWADWNQNGRLNLVLAIVDDGTFKIDRYVANTGDYAKFEGHYYSDKAPGMSFLGVPVYAVVRPILNAAPVQSVIDRLARSDAFSATVQDGSGPATEQIYFMLVLIAVTFATVAVPSALLGVLLYSFLGAFDQRRGWRVAIALLYGLATPAFPYANAFYGHHLVAVLMFAAFWIAFRIARGELTSRWALLAGFLLGYTVITEYPAALIVAGIGLYLLFALPRKLWIVPAALVGLLPVLLMMWYNWSIFHTVLPVGYKYSELWPEVHNQGFLSLTGPNADAIWGITFGVHRGLFFIAPLLLLAIPGFVAWRQVRRWQRELAVCLWAVLSFFLFNGSSVMWQGGFAVGPRYLVPMLPFMMAAVGVFVYAWGAHWWARLALGVGALLSFLNVWVQTIGGSGFPQYQANPLLEYSLPNLLNQQIARNLGLLLDLNGFVSLLPILAFLVLGTLALFLSIRAAAPSTATSPTLVRSTPNLGSEGSVR